MLVLLGPEDLAEVMRLERLEGYDALIGRFEADEHAAELASSGARYLGWRGQDGRLEGFVILQQFDAPIQEGGRTVRLRRIAVETPGLGVGTRLLRGVIDWLFRTSDAAAVDLHVRPGNDRARAVYIREGFTPMGILDSGSEEMLLTRQAWDATPRP
jgi:RimJ/RimL family protein N-acetyltransferase